MTSLCAHVWIDLADPPIARAPVSPAIGSMRHEMKDGHTYACQRCGTERTVDVHAMLRRAGVAGAASVLGTVAAPAAEPVAESPRPLFPTEVLDVERLIEETERGR